MDYLQYQKYGEIPADHVIVLNLIINGLPSILKNIMNVVLENYKISFKPYYKWITFNIKMKKELKICIESFKPYYKWITFNILNLNVPL